MFPNANVAYCAVVAGVAIGYIELLRPGLVIPGAAGAALAMLGVASLAAYPLTLRGLLLIAAGFALAALDARLQLRGTCAAAGALAMTLGARWLVADDISRIRWSVAPSVSIPFLLTTWWLMERAFRARANKLDF